MKQLALVVDAKKDILSADLQSNMIQYLRTIAAPQTPPDYRPRALKYLASFAKIPRLVLEGLVPELVGYAETEGNTNIKNGIEEALLSLRTQNMPLERDLWEDFYRYIRALIANTDPERRDRGRKLNQKMRQITLNAKKGWAKGKS